MFINIDISVRRKKSLGSLGLICVFCPRVYFAQGCFIYWWDDLLHLIPARLTLAPLNPLLLPPAVGHLFLLRGSHKAEAGVDEEDKGDEEYGEVGGHRHGPVLLRQEVQTPGLQKIIH